MFVLKDKVTSYWPVRVREPNPKSPGTFSEFKFDVEFTLIDRDQAKAENDRRSAILEDESKTAEERIAELNAFDDDSFVAVISDWKGVFDEERNEVPFSRDILLLALKQQHIRKAVQEAYQEMASGEGRRKN